MWTGVQFTGTLVPGQPHRWFTFGWPTTLARRLVHDADVAADRARRRSTGTSRSSAPNATQCTYWITVKNLTPTQRVLRGALRRI